MNRRLFSFGITLAVAMATPALAAADNTPAQPWGGAPAWGQQVAAQSAPTTPAAPPPAPWDANCTGKDRSHPLDCQIEQRVVVSNSGQLLVDMTLRLPTDANDPVMLIHTPFGLFLPAGLRLAVDGADVASLPLQTCDAGGCYAGSPVDAKLLNAMQHGSTLTVTFQNLEKKDIAIPVSLLGFDKAYGQIR